MEPRGRVLIVAGSDSSGGAGIQADVKTVTALGGYASTAITALTAQNTLGVQAVMPVDPDFVDLQMQVVLDDIGTDAVKTGMMYSRWIIETVVRRLRTMSRSIPVVVDPVFVSGTGASLLDREGRIALVKHLLPAATLLTPNAPEAAAITGIEVKDLDGMSHAADRLLLMGPEAVLIKGGHLEGDTVIDLLRTADGLERRFESPRVKTRALHGTGCTLASAIAVGLAEGMTLEGAVQTARDYVLAAIRTAPGYGSGSGVLNHVHPIE
ncbi:MAG TPA: bifunctional hydroxymethylpyrimidine kinase/phosphomethylpyrimidine kinase [Polyangiaceae bacterium]|jgi:hydroxymethylpyrimidine/phosphomethylpyrimidine kinase|nr:bifunctional hydroxymethylpyrimidine kinase/phosphomethylpyrimidine kinase [Polyangiaceae bacterium]